MTRKRKREVRQKRIIANNGHTEYMDVDLTPLYDSPKGKRPDPKQESTVIQKNLNDKNSKRLFHRKACHNFAPGDYMLTLPYRDAFFPTTWKDADREADNFIRRYNRLRKGLGLPRAKYMIVTECTIRKSGKHAGQQSFHHHLLISGGVDQKTLEGLWRRRKKKGEKEGELIGYPTSKNLYFDENGIEGLMVYFFGEEKTRQQRKAGVPRPKYKRRWRGSTNLTNPTTKRPNDTRWSDKQVEKLAEEIRDSGKSDPAYWEKQYPGYRFSQCTAEFNEVTGRWSIYLRMHRRN